MKPFRAIRIVIAVLALTLSAGIALAAAPVAEEVRQRMTAAGAGGQVPVIVSFAERLDLEPFARRSDRAQARSEMIQGLQGQARRSQGPLQAFLRRQGVEPTELWLVNAMAVRVPVPLVDTIAQWPGVAAVDLDGQVPPPAPVTLAVSAAPTSNIAALGVQPLWDAGFSGSGVVVASLDTGVDVTHPALSARWRGGIGDWFDPYASTATPNDADGHGTAVASLMVGGSLPVGLGASTIGVVPDAQWIAAKIFPDGGGAADNSKIHLAFQWALDPDRNPLTDDAPDVVNNSWGFDSAPNQCLSDPFFRSDIQALQAAGIHVVFSAGNSGPAAATSISLANYPEGLAVGSIDSTSAISSFSARGPNACSGSIYNDLAVDVYPELVAPGELVTVALPTNIFASGYGFASGTSYSAPHVSGALALLRGAVPPVVGESAADYRLRLERGLLESSADLGPLGADNSYGRGLVDLPAAYDRLTVQPHLSVYDQSAPENDDTLDFGPVTPGTARDLAFVLKNRGSAVLAISAINSNFPTPALTLIGNTCPAVLAVGAQCMLTVRFAPVAFASYSGQIVVSSSLPTRTLAVAGVGNSQPPAAQLIAPANGALGVARPVTFSWSQGGDADGDTLSLTLLIDTDPHFSPAERIIPNLAFAATVSGVLVAGIGLVFHWPRTCRRRLLMAAALLGAVWLTVSCGGGGNSGGVVVPGGSITVDNLNPNTTYYWKLLTTDSHGGQVESEVRSFKTQ